MIRIKLDNPSNAREEIVDPERSALREMILDANARGDATTVAQLQVLYRQRRVPAFGPAHRARTRDESRQVVGRLCSWDHLTSGRDGWQKLGRGCFDAFLEVHDEIPLCLQHDGVKIGVVRHFAPDVDGMRVLAEVDEGPLGDEILSGLEDGRLTGFSVWAEAMSRRELINTHRGLPVFETVEAILREASLCAEPADPECVVETVGGREPRWRQVEDALDRDARLRMTWRRR